MNDTHEDSIQDEAFGEGNIWAKCQLSSSEQRCSQTRSRLPAGVSKHTSIAGQAAVGVGRPESNKMGVGVSTIDLAGKLHQC